MPSLDIQGHAIIQRPWSNLLHTVRTGETAFDAVFGCSLFEYFESNPDAAELFTAGIRPPEHLSIWMQSSPHMIGPPSAQSSMSAEQTVHC